MQTRLGAVQVCPCPGEEASAHPHRSTRSLVFKKVKVGRVFLSHPHFGFPELLFGWEKEEYVFDLSCKDVMLNQIRILNFFILKSL